MPHKCFSYILWDRSNVQCSVERSLSHSTDVTFVVGCTCRKSGRGDQGVMLVKRLLSRASRYFSISISKSHVQSCKPLSTADIICTVYQIGDLRRNLVPSTLHDKTVYGVLIPTRYTAEWFSRASLFQRPM